MKALTHGGCFAVFVFLTVALGSPVSAQEAHHPPVRINEVLPNPEGNEYEKEFIELKKPMDTDISGWELKLQKLDEPAHEADTIAIHNSYTENKFALLEEQLSQDLYNGGMRVWISKPQAAHGEHTQLQWSASIEEGSSQAWNETSGSYYTTPSPTKGAANEFAGEPSEEHESSDSSLGPATLRIKQFLPNPHGSDQDKELLTITNYGETAISLEDWQLLERRGSEMNARSHSLPARSLGAGDTITLNEHMVSLTNTPEPTILFSLVRTDETVAHTISYSQAPEGKVLWYSPQEQQMVWQVSNESDNDSKPRKYGNKIAITEVFPAPHQDQASEFVEVSYEGKNRISLEEWTLSDKAGEVTLSDVHTIPPEGYLLLSRTETDLALNNSGTEAVTLAAPDGSEVSSVSYTDAPRGESYAQSEAGEWKWTASRTPQAPNTFASVTYQDISPQSEESPKEDMRTEPHRTHLRINELLPDPQEVSDNVGEFVELTNTGDQPLNMNAWRLEIQTKGETRSEAAKITLPEESVKAQSRASLWGRNTSLQLPNTGAKLRLISPADNIVDTAQYGKAQSGASYSFSPGMSGFQWTTQITPGKENKFSSVSQPDEENPSPKKEDTEEQISQLEDTEHLRLVEVYPYPPEDQSNEFLELQYTGPSGKSLKGWEITDGVSTFTFPDRRLKSNQRLTLDRSETGIALNNHGEESLTLRSPQNEVVQHITFQDPPQGASYARKDGEWKYTQTVTREKPNTIQEPEKPSQGQESDTSATREVHALKTIWHTQDETKINLTARVWVPPHVLSDRFFLVSDGERALKVYNYKQNFPELKPGDQVNITGEVSSSQKDTRITSNKPDITVQASGEVRPPQAVEGSATTISPANQGKRVTLTGELLEQSGDSFYVRTTADKRARVALLPTVSLEKPDMRAGDTVSISGLIDVYREDVRLLVWQKDSITPHASTSSEDSTDAEKKTEESAPDTQAANDPSSFELSALMENGAGETQPKNQSGRASLTSYVANDLPSWIREHVWWTIFGSLGALWSIGSLLVWRMK